MRPPLEVRERAGKLELEGYASVFSTWYPIGPTIEEQIVPGAFKRTLDSTPPPAVALRVEHDALPLAHTRSGTLQLSEDTRGLLAVAQLNPRDPDAQTVRAKSENSPLEMSFAFRCNRDKWSEDLTRRSVLEVTLHQGDVSVVCYGANPATSLAVDERGLDITLEQRQAFVERVKGWVGGPRVSSYTDIPLAVAERGKYAAHQLAELGGKGEAFGPAADGHWSFPPHDRDDLESAIKMVGLSGSSHNAVRRYLMKRAKEMGLSHLIPPTWASDGSARSSVSLPDFTTTASQQLEVLRAGRPRRAVGTRSTLAATSARQEAELAALRRVNR